MFELRERGKKKRPSHSGLKQGRAAVVAVGKGTGRGGWGGGVWRARWGGGDGCRLASCQLAPAAGPCQSKLPNEKL